MADMETILHIVAQLVGYSILGALTVIQCGGKKKGGTSSAAPKTAELPKSDKDEGTKKSDKKEDASGAPKPDGPKAPTDKNAVAGTHDPNYQTLAGVDANVFQEKGGAASPAAAAPAAGAPKAGGPGMAATHDPNYQTLAGIGNDCFDKKDGAKPAAGGAAAPAAPKAGGPGMAATHDPNYQTLAGIGNDCFQKK
uniref:Secreted protein n=1 Tax=Caenorhabditis tropicalis TaxID=1561998 RepID=A0A1I7TQY9_9PELO